MTAPTRWTLSPTDSPFVAALRYLPAAFFGGYILLGAVSVLTVLPALVANPSLLAVVVLLGLVGGPLCLLYPWPVLRDPNQRPTLGESAWFADLQPARVVGAGFDVTAIAIATVGGVPVGVRGYVAAVTAALGVVFFLGAYYVA